MKPKIVFFSRAYQEVLFPLLNSELYVSVHVTLTKEEKYHLELQGLTVDFCFETFKGSVDKIPDKYLLTSLVSDRFLDKYSFKKRRMILKREIAFWSTIFEKYQQIAVINEQVAIEIAEVMYIEAKKRGIRYLSWMTNPINGYFYWIADPITLALEKKILDIKPSTESIKIANEYLLKVIEKHERPYYIMPFLKRKKSKEFISSIKGLIKLQINKIKGKISFYEDSTYATVNFFERALKSYFVKYDSIKNLEDYEIVTFPLHYEPEASLSYLSEFFSNQVALIENLTKCLKVNQLLVIKEHPAQFGMLLTKKYQKLKKNNSQIVFLPSTISSYDIIKKSDVIITLTSHLGWEALILGKPVFLLGKMFYDKYPYINKFESFDKLKNDIQNKNYLFPKQEATVKYIAQLIEVSYKGMPFPCENLYKKENIELIRSAIEKELKLI